MAIVDVQEGGVEETNVRISWNQPDARGSIITEYEIKIRSSDGEFYEEETECHGSD